MNLQLPDYLQPLEKLHSSYPEAVIAQAIERRDETIPTSSAASNSPSKTPTA